MGALIDAEQAERLRREGWNGTKGAKRLAEELYTMFTSEKPYYGDPINIIQNGGPVFNIIEDGSVPPITQGPPIYPGDPPSPATTPITGGAFAPSDTESDPTATGPLAMPIAGWGRVLSRISGNNYLVRVWVTNPLTTAALADMTITQMQIDPTDVIPAGTEIPVTLYTVTSGGGLRVVSGVMQVPVFLERT